jgi:two-component system sensor histidine kinase BaeS
MMRTRITYKIFFAIFATVIFAVVLVSTAASVSFKQGFLGYLNDVAEDRIDLLLPNARQAYRVHGNWDFLRGQTRAWFDLLRSTSAPEARNENASTDTLTTSDLTGAFLRMGLMDAQHQWVAGYREINDAMHKYPINVDGVTVGWLVLASFQSVAGAGNERFQQDQFHSLLVASLIAVLLAGLIAYWLARVLLAPMKDVARATHQLAAGQYDTRVSVKSRDEISQLAADFNHLAQTLQRNERMRRNFMAEISHELRTPLTILRGEIDAMTEGIRQVTPIALSSLQAEVATLSQLVNDLYELSLSDAGALSYRFHPLDLRELLTLTAESYTARMAAQDIAISLHLPQRAVGVNGDSARLQQLFHNLMENTLRYTHSSGRLEITVKIVARWVSIEWQDSAPGVSDALLPHLFERFFRADTTARPGTRGAGLGLAICRNIVEAHGGSIEARHSAHGGLCVLISLPNV